MFTLSTFCADAARVLALALTFCPVALYAAMDPRFELDTTAIEALAPSSRPTAGIAKKQRRISRQPKTPDPGSSKAEVYIVRKGDNLFKILMHSYSLTNDEAEALIEDIRYENNIYDIKRLKVGQKIIIPPIRRSSDNAAAVTPAGGSGASASKAAVHGLRLEAPVFSAPHPHVTVDAIRKSWDRLIPASGDELKSLFFSGPSYALTLDPLHYPVFTAQDGTRIILDQEDAIPSLVKSLITVHHPKVKIISESAAEPKRLLGSMIHAAGFYSVEEDFVMDFGNDPKLNVRADFKIEKTPDSLLNNEIILFNGSRRQLPPVLTGYLKQQGFAVHEPFAAPAGSASEASRQRIYQVSTKQPQEIADVILGALAIPYRSSQQVDIFPAAKTGIALSVKVDRTFEKDAQRFVMASFDGDPVTYTLLRILETTGYQVITLDRQDTFQSVTRKVLSSLNLPGAYAVQQVLRDDASNYSLQISGFRLENQATPEETLLLTDRPVDGIFKSILKENSIDILQH